ncbi:Protein kinase C-like phorbol ester/diacylglycerol-binding domain [Arabidopsis thaliana x Arabidopsis arenosa]|uniref:Protein kinase C-like phorbol ester/diacylglycerol-binding domain n=1 Tax=Arabidopsis thaliana x Arabidopsis arenosa TaxID=1240361 RepID=A0A8T2BZ84_9BRAS|nr:Protein kinase C-like phorbol ester/diacylglycerol-binding domain [Arabidopsis thaliana x Arabidopsis arenosa]
MEILKKIYSLVPTRGLKCDGCNLGEDSYSDGYRCFRSGLFFHKQCSNSDIEIHNLYHPQHSLHIKVVAEYEDVHDKCKLCRGNLPKIYYYCSTCDFAIDLVCARKEVIITIQSLEIHEHRLSLIPKMVMFTCSLCGLLDDRFPYACTLCDLSFHKDCAESTPEINYSCHPCHILKRFTRVPSYTDGKCCLCGNTPHNIFYHCSICNFSVDVDCAKNPPPFTLVQPKAHKHSLTLMPQRNFVCNVCGLDDDPNPYICIPCNFMIHRNCIDIPRVIKISRHDHRIYYNHCLEAGDRNCGVCHKEINWTRGAYSCLKCPNFTYHVRCATRSGIWDRIELEGIPENTLEVRSYKVIKEGVIEHFSHKDHTLKLKEESDNNDECISCKACTYPIFSSPFYSCMECEDFMLHQKCAYLPKQKVDSLYKMSTTLSTKKPMTGSFKICSACQNVYNGFTYESDNKCVRLDVRCGSIPEPFVHESHPLHSLYINYSKGNMVCNACGDKSTMVLSCEECEFVLDIKCSILPKIVKHENDKDHLLSLCYGENTSERYWCEVCEEELNPKKWFYSCDHCVITFHIKCALGDFTWMEPRGDDESPKNVFRNNRMTRPICSVCYSLCQFPSVLIFGVSCCCSLRCFQKAVHIVA